MNMNFVSVVILCVSGLLYFHNAFGETENAVSILNDIRNELNHLKLSNKRNEHKIMRLQTQINECRRRYAELDEQKAIFAHTNKRLVDMEHKVEASHEKLSKRLKAVELPRTIRNGGIRDRVDDVHDIKESKSQIDKRIVPVTSAPSSNTRIAFTASIAHRVSGLKYQQIIPFDHSPTNEGQAFDPVSHTFTCPVSGIYYFASSLIAEDNQTMVTELVKDGSMLALVFSKSGSGLNDYQQGFNSQVVVCNKGDRVWVRNFEHYGTALLSGVFTTFSGFLVTEL